LTSIGSPHVDIVRTTLIAVSGIALDNRSVVI